TVPGGSGSPDPSAPGRDPGGRFPAGGTGPCGSHELLGHARIEPSPATPAAAADTSIAAEAGPRHADGVGAAIVFRDHLDILMMVAAVQLVLEAEVREVDRLIEVGQVVFVRPPFDFVPVAIRSSVAVGPAAIGLLEPLLILALELLFEHDAPNLRALVS